MVEVRPLQIVDYATEDGKVPYRTWIDSLKDEKAKAIIEARLTRVRSGNLGAAESVGQGVFELKIDFGPGYRVYFGRDGETVVVLLLGGSKKRQSADIETAKKYWVDYRRIGK